MDPAGDNRRPNPPPHTLKGGREGTNEQGPRHVSLSVGSCVGSPVLALKRRDGREHLDVEHAARRAHESRKREDSP